MNLNEIVFAPVVISTLCRDKHFIACIESLRTNTWACHTDVFIALDYPKTEAHWDGYKKICGYLEADSFPEFHSFHVEKRERNYGAGVNSYAMIQEVAKKYDRWISAEDDIIFSRVFLEYMDQALARYEDDPTVLAVNGYSYPLDWKVASGATALLQDGTYSAWGTGQWREKHCKTRAALQSGYLREHFEEADRSGLLKKLIRGRYNDYVIYALSGNEDGLYTRPTDVAMGIYMKLVGGKVVTPVISKTRNVGFDGSGLYCRKITQFTGEHSKAYDYSKQPIDDADTFILVPDDGAGLQENVGALDRFLYVSKKSERKAKLMYGVYKLVGKKNCGRLYQFLKARRKEGRR